MDKKLLKDVTKYTKQELIDNFHIFGVPKECVIVALRDVNEATKSDAIKLVKKFMNKEVK